MATHRSYMATYTEALANFGASRRFARVYDANAASWAMYPAANSLQSHPVTESDHSQGHRTVPSPVPGIHRLLFSHRLVNRFHYVTALECFGLLLLHLFRSFQRNKYTTISVMDDRLFNNILNIFNQLRARCDRNDPIHRHFTETFMLTTILREFRQPFGQAFDNASDQIDPERLRSPGGIPFMYAVRRIARLVLQTVSRLVPEARTVDDLLRLMIPDISTNDIERFRSGYLLGYLPTRNNREQLAVFRGMIPIKQTR